MREELEWIFEGIHDLKQDLRDLETDIKSIFYYDKAKQEGYLELINRIWNLLFSLETKIKVENGGSYENQG